MAQMQPDPDARVVEVLRSVGGDLRQPTEFIVFLYFPTTEAAAAAAARLRAIGFPDVLVSESLHGKWGCIGTRQMVPDARAIRQLRSVLERLAEEHGGEYDGWEAAVQPYEA
jgi:hypothetical protein